MLKLKKMCKYTVKDLPFEIRFVPDLYEIYMRLSKCDKAILEIGEMVESVSIFFVLLCP